MTTKALIENIKHLLQSEFIKDCYRALEDVRQLLADRRDKQLLLPLLQEVAETHHYATIQNLALEIYQEYTKPEIQSESNDIGEQVPISCPRCQFTNYFDKTILCSSRIIHRGPKLSRVKLYSNCTHCDFEFTDYTVDIDCGLNHG